MGLFPSDQIIWPSFILILKDRMMNKESIANSKLIVAQWIDMSLNMTTKNRLKK